MVYMRNRLGNIYSRLLETVKQTPLEIGVAILYCLLWGLDVSREIDIKDFGWTFPICFCVIYGMNLFTRERSGRWMYYASILVVVGLWFWNLKLDDTVYWVSLIISQLFVIYGWREFENKQFVGSGINYVCDMAGAFCLGLLCQLLSFAIYDSFTYIFDISTSGSKFYVYISIVSYLFATPIFFLAFNSKRRVEPEINHFSSFLVNFILSPALLIYMIVLYLYLVKIVVIWSLPKGGVAYMVTSFIILVFLVRAVQPMLGKRYYDWFYNYFSWWVFPALIMLWVGVSYRLWQYGLTEKRFYLLLTVITLTLTVMMSFRHKQVRYAVLVGISGILLALFTYIPGISARDIGIASQLSSLKQAILELGIGDSSGFIVKQNLRSVDSTLGNVYKRLYESFKFLEKEKGGQYMAEHFGVFASDELRDSIFSIPERKLLAASQGKKRSESIYLYDTPNVWDKMDIRRFSIIENVNNSSNGIYYSYTDDGELTIQRDEKTIARINLNEWFIARLTESGLDMKSYTQEELALSSSSFMICDIGKIRLIFDQLVINTTNNKVKEVGLSYMLSE